MGRTPCCDKDNVKRGPWSLEEDAKLKSYIDQHGTGGNWIALPQKIGLKRCGKSCRLRWLNYLRPNLKHGGFSEEEENFICRLYISIGSRWSIMAAQLPGRTDNDIKNYWNTRLKKKLFGEQPRNNHNHQTRKISNGGAAAAARNKETWEPQQIPPVQPVRHQGADLGSSSPPFFAGVSSPLLLPLDCGQDLASSSQPPQSISESSAGSAAKLDELFQLDSVNPGGLDCLCEEGMVENWACGQLWDLQEHCLTPEEPVQGGIW